MYVRLPDLLAELDLATVQENYRKRINQYIKCNLLILDERLLIGTNNAEQQDILEILEKRYRIHSTVFCSQFDVAGWHSDYSLVIAPVVADLCTTPVALSAPPNSYQNNSQS